MTNDISINTTTQSLFSLLKKRSMPDLANGQFLGFSCCFFPVDELFDTDQTIWEEDYFLKSVAPEESNLLIIGGSINFKLLPHILEVYKKMKKPSWVIAVGNCAIGGELYKESSLVVQGISKYLPVDLYIPGCPPTVDELWRGFTNLEKLVSKGKNVQ